MEYIVYTDGGCSGNKRDAGCPGGYGYLILDPAKTKLFSGGGKGENTTNNIMEMTAVIRGCESLHIYLNKYSSTSAKKHDCLIVTDSKYVCDNYNEYLHLWKRNGWRKSNGSSVLNKELWKRIDRISSEFNSFRFKWVKGHSRDKFNNLVDEIAQSHMRS